MRANSRFHRRGNPQGLMHATEVVPHVEQCDLVRVVLDLFGKGIGQPGKAAHSHSHVEVLAFDVGSRNMLGIGVASDGLRDCADTSRGAVSRVRFKIAPVNLHEHCVVDPSAERILNGCQIHLVAVCGQLDAVRQPRLNVLKERGCKPRVSLSYHPTDNQLAICVNRGERPHVAANAITRDLLFRDVLLLAGDERSDLVDLYALGLDVADGGVQELSTGRAHALKQAEDRAFRHNPSCGKSKESSSLRPMP